MLTTLINILCLVLAGYIIKKFFIKNPVDVARELSSKCVGSLGEISYKMHVKNEQKKAISKEGTFMDSKYYLLCREILADLDMGATTVEALTLVIGIISVSVGLIVGTVIRSTGLGIVTIPITYSILLTTLYMVATVGHYKRLFAFMDAETLIISTLDRGVFASVELNISQFDPLIKPYYQEFIDNVKIYKMPFNDAIDILGNRIGPRFDDFKEKAKVLENNKRAGSEEVFNDNLKLNTKLRVRSIKLMDFISEVRGEYTKCVILVFVFATISFAQVDGLLDYLTTNVLGQTLLAVHVIAIAISYAWIQSLRKDLKSKEAKVKK